MDALQQANRSLYEPSEPKKPTGLAQQFPYSYEPGSQYGAAPGGLAPDSSMYAPSGQQAPQQPPPQAQAPAMPQMQFGPEDDGGAANAANARSLGQGVLAASQEATKKKGMGGMGSMGGGMGG